MPTPAGFRPSPTRRELAITRLDEDRTGTLALRAQAGVVFKRRAGTVARSFRFEVPPPVPGTTGEVAAISTAMGRLADGVAAMLAAPSVRR